MYPILHTLKIGDQDDSDFDSINIFPSEGLIEPFGESAVFFLFKPREEVMQKGFRKKSGLQLPHFFAMSCTIEASETKQKIGWCACPVGIQLYHIYTTNTIFIYTCIYACMYVCTPLSYPM